MERRTTSFKLRPDIVSRFHAKRKERKQTACEVIETFMEVYTDGLVYVAEGKVFVVANIKFEPHYEGRPRSRYKKKKDEVVVYEFGSPSKCCECDKPADFRIISNLTEKEKAYEYYCSYHFNKVVGERFRAHGRISYQTKQDFSRWG